MPELEGRAGYSVNEFEGVSMARYDLTRFLTTHNSYSGGPRGSLRTQLDARIRCLELDIHDNGWNDGVQDFRVGHLKPGMEVSLGQGNPTTLVLRDWLATVAGWSAANPGHAPITLVLDAKDDFTDSDDGGDLEDLNGILQGAFGQKLFTRDHYDQTGAWPEVSALQNRVLCVLSGSGSSRAAYRWAFGSAPAIAVNTNGQVVLAYLSTIGDLRMWTGTADGSANLVSWLRKLNYRPESPSVSEPAVAVADDGWIVLVYRFSLPSFPDRLASHVGRLQPDGTNEGRIKWLSRSQIFAAGVSPSLKITGNSIIEIHTMQNGQREEVRGTLNRQSKKIEWRKPRATPSARFPIDLATNASRDIACAVDAAGWIGYAFDGGVLQPARFRQTAFVEIQKGEDRSVFRDPLFFAADAKHRAAIAQARTLRLVARAWGFEDGDQANPRADNMPATNTPSASWYQTYMQGPDVAS